MLLQVSLQVKTQSIWKALFPLHHESLIPWVGGPDTHYVLTEKYKGLPILQGQTLSSGGLELGGYQSPSPSSDSQFKVQPRLTNGGELDSSPDTASPPSLMFLPEIHYQRG